VGIGYSLVLIVLLRDRPADTVPVGTVAVPGPRVRLGEAMISLFSRRAFIVALFFWGLLGLASWAFVGWLPTYLHEQFQLSQGRAGLTALGYISTASLVGAVVGGVWADRWSRIHPRGRIYVSVIGLLIALPAILLVANAPLLAFVLAGLLLYGFARPFPDANIVPILCQIVDPRYLATGIGVLNTFATLIGGASIYAGGALRDAQVSTSTVFNFGAFCIFLGAVLLWFIKPRLNVSTPTNIS
jgi:MFS family permease